MRRVVAAYTVRLPPSVLPSSSAPIPFMMSLRCQTPESHSPARPDQARSMLPRPRVSVRAELHQRWAQNYHSCVTLCLSKSFSLPKTTRRLYSPNNFDRHLRLLWSLPQVTVVTLPPRTQAQWLPRPCRAPTETDHEDDDDVSCDQRTCHCKGENP